MPGVEGRLAEADLNLGCGVPTRHAALRPGETVLDLGSGAGNDVFIARREVGPEGSVIGVDMTPDDARSGARERRASSAMPMSSSVSARSSTCRSTPAASTS